MVEPFDFGHPNPVGPSPKLGYEGCHRSSRRLINIAVQFGIDDGLDGGDLSSSLPYTGLGERSEVVHIEKSDSIKLGSRRVDVAGYGYVDYEQVTASTFGNHIIEVAVLEDDCGSPSRGEEDIDVGQVSG